MKISLIGDMDSQHLELLKATAIQCQQAEKIAQKLCIQLQICNDTEIQVINFSHREKNSPTDVLSFPSMIFPYGTLKDNINLLQEVYDDEMRAYFIGDCILSMETAKRQAELYGHGLERELAFLFAHSIFHLFGYDHQTPEQELQMREKQKLVMQKLGLEIES